MTNQRGISVLEVLIVVGMLAIVITGVGAALNANHRLTTAAEAKSGALGYARQALEVVTAIQSAAFGCSGAVNGTCTASDGQLCQTRPGYTSCWTEFARGLTSNDPLQLTSNGLGWQVTSGEETIVAGRTYQRHLSIANQQRNATGKLVETGGNPDFNTKEVTVVVSWQETGATKDVTLSTILTAWKN